MDNYIIRKIEKKEVINILINIMKRQIMKY